METTTTHLAIEVSSANTLLQYLAARPYSEVADIIMGLQQSQPISLKPQENGGNSQDYEVK